MVFALAGDSTMTRGLGMRLEKGCASGGQRVATAHRSGAPGRGVLDAHAGAAHGAGAGRVSPFPRGLESCRLLPSAAMADQRCSLVSPAGRVLSAGGVRP